MLKADLHIHTKEDREDIIKYSARQLIDRAAGLKYDVLAITLHNDVLYNSDLVNYAKSKGILLIPGIEASIENADVLIYNVKKADLKGIKRTKDLRALKKSKPEILIAAPHPYFPFGRCLGNKLDKFIDVFDAVELSWFYCNSINLNKRAIKLAKAHKKAIIATSDVHYIQFFGRYYTMIDADKNIQSVLDAIRRNRVKIYSKPMSCAKFFFLSVKLLFNKVFGIDHR